jgi:hypothetical protein
MIQADKTRHPYIVFNRSHYPGAMPEQYSSTKRIAQPRGSTSSRHRNRQPTDPIGRARIPSSANGPVSVGVGDNAHDGS